MRGFLPLALSTLLLLVACAGPGTEVGDVPADPLQALRGKVWVVEDIDHRGIIDMSRVTIEIDAGDRAGGRASCNRWFAPVTSADGGIRFGRAGSTMMACGESLMNQEQRFLATLARVRRFEIDATGALLLSGPDDAWLKAYPES
ncbi:MAG TPA: META domain-containing protein [Pseudomonadales bacterium]|nr:META domain-containing protein [Pseudomonadales bacterium]